MLSALSLKLKVGRIGNEITMKQLKITQNNYGNYNLLGGKDTSFSLAIVEDGKTITKEEGEKKVYCRVHYFNDEDRVQEFQELFDGGRIDELFAICLKDAGREDEEGCLYFYEVYRENQAELEKNWKEERESKLRAELERVLSTTFGNLEVEATRHFDSKRKRIDKELDYQRQKLADLKEGSPTYEETAKKITELEAKLEVIPPSPNSGGEQT